MPVPERRKKELIERIKRARTTTAPENAVGQWIASFFEAGVTNSLKEIVNPLPDYELVPPNGRKTWRLPNVYGEKRQIDYVISERALGGKPVIIIEDKWLKDQRHLKDKGSWIIAMQGIQKANPSIRGIIAILAGEWNEGTINAINQVAHVFHIPTEGIYNKLKEVGIEVVIDKEREAFVDPARLLEDILTAVETRLPDEDVITELGKEIVKDIVPDLKKTIMDILYPKSAEIADKYELSVTTNWGRIHRIVGKTVRKPPSEITDEVRKIIEKNE